MKLYNDPEEDVLPHTEHQIFTLGGGIKTPPQLNMFPPLSIPHK